MHHAHPHTGGQSILEVILALMIFGLIAAAMASMAAGSANGLIQGGEYTRAEGLAEEGIEAVRSIRDDAWNQLAYQKGVVQISGDSWNLVDDENGTGDTIGQFTRTIAFNDVCRNGASGDIVPCPPPSSADYADAESREVAVDVSWETRPGVSNSVKRIQYLTDWDSKDISDAAKADFESGAKNGTFATDSGGVSDDVRLIEANPFKTSVVHKALDLSGNENANDIFIDEYSDILYLVTNVRTTLPDTQEFFAYDISDVTSGTVTLLNTGANPELGVNVTGVYVAKGYAFLATEKAGEELMVIRLSDYTKITSWSPPGITGLGLSVNGSGDRVFLGTRNDAIAREWFVIDVSNPENIPPAPLGSADLGGNAYETALAAGYAFIAVGNSNRELQIFDANTSLPVNEVNVPGGTDVRTVFAAQDEVYVGKTADGSDKEFYVFKIANLLGGDDTVFRDREVGDDVLDIFVEGDYAYLATNDGGNELQVINLGDPTYPIYFGNADGANPCNRIWFYTAYVYLACRADTDELQVMRSTFQSGWENPTRYGEGDVAGSADGFAVAVVGNYAFVGTESNNAGHEFYVFEIDPLGGTALVHSLEIGGTVNDIMTGTAGIDTFAFLATSNNEKELVAINITNPETAFETRSYNANGGADGRSIYRLAGRLYLGTANNPASAGRCTGSELYVIRLSDFSCLGSFDALNVMNDVVVAGNYLYGATPHNTNEVIILNISNPASITQAGVFNQAAGNGDGRGLALDGTDLYLVREDGGADHDFYILDIGIGHETSPVLISSLNTGNNFRVAIESGEHAFLASSQVDQELKVIDVRDKNRPVVQGRFDAEGAVRDVFYDPVATYAYLATADNFNELQIVGPSKPSFPRRGTFTSRAFDLLAIDPSARERLQVLKWAETIPVCIPLCDIKLLFRSSPIDVNDLRKREWAGPDDPDDGDRDDFFITPTGTLINQLHNDHQYFQYKAILMSDGAKIPELEEVTINYK